MYVEPGGSLLISSIVFWQSTGSFHIGMEYNAWIQLMRNGEPLCFGKCETISACLCIWVHIPYADSRLPATGTLSIPSDEIPRACHLGSSFESPEDCPTLVGERDNYGYS